MFSHHHHQSSMYHNLKHDMQIFSFVHKKSLKDRLIQVTAINKEAATKKLEHQVSDISEWEYVPDTSKESIKA